MALKVETTKAKITRWGYTKVKSFGKAKETISKMKKQCLERKNVHVNHVSDKRSMSKIYKDFIFSNSQTNKQTNAR